MNKNAANLIETELAAERWSSAHRLIVAELKRAPKDHWLMTRLALTFYERRKYDQALYWDLMALRESPYCPLATWGYAGDLDMLDRVGEALLVYRKLLSWGEERLAWGECGEGIRRARSLVADCRYRIACIWQEKRQWKRSAAEFDRYIALRRKGYGSIYSLREARGRYLGVRAKLRP